VNPKLAAGLAAVFLGLVPSLSESQPAGADLTGMSCIQRLDIPRYPGVARRARVQGVVEVTTGLKADGSIESIRFAPARDRSESILAAFHPEIEKAIRASKFSANCTAKAVKVNFRFRLFPQANALEDDERRVWFEYPNVFEIAMPGPTAQP